MKKVKITKTENGHEYIKSVDEGLVSIYKMQGWELYKEKKDEKKNIFSTNKN